VTDIDYTQTILLHFLILQPCTTILINSAAG